MKTKLNIPLIATVGVLSIIAFGVIALRFFTAEDTWICENGKWTKHGNPSTDMPETDCGEKQITSFDECVASNNIILESYPRQCRTDSGNLFVEDIGNELEMLDYITVDNPRPNAEIQEKFDLTGAARGTWYFEAIFPVKLYDDTGLLLFEGHATATQDWMTDEFVTFQLEISFNNPATSKGKLVLEQSNPSDSDEDRPKLEIPVRFK